MSKISASMWPAGPEYPTLQKLDSHIAHLDRDGPARVTIDPPIAMSEPKRAKEILCKNYEKKKAKIADYAEGHPVWLVFIAQSNEQNLLAISLVDHLKNEDTFDPRPFERVLLGCFTAGVTFEEPNIKPRYTSLTATG